MHDSMCTCVNACVRACVHACRCVCVCVCTCAFVYASMCVCLCMSAYTYACMCSWFSLRAGWCLPRSSAVGDKTAGAQRGVWAGSVAVQLHFSRQRLSHPWCVVLHAFFGHRRSGDTQHEVEDRVAASICRVLVLSVENALCGTKCDLLDPNNVCFWLDLVGRGKILQAVTSPPCETWSAARFLADGPPLLWSLAPLGVRGSKLKHHQQVRVGSVLMLVIARLFVAAAGAGVAALNEHPTEPHWLPEVPSICRTFVWEAIAQLEGVVTIRYHQCEFGAIGIKATLLMACRMPALRGLIPNLQCVGSCTHGGHPSLAGRGPDGQFRTAQATEYPSGLCAIIADASRAVGEAAGLLDLVGEGDALSSFHSPTPDATARKGVLIELRALFEFVLKVSFLSPYGDEGTDRDPV